MKILSLLQPWASLLVLRIKLAETRSWGSMYRGPVGIHASMGIVRERDVLKYIFDALTDEDFEVLKSAGLYGLSMAQWPRGVVLGVGTLYQIRGGTGLEAAKERALGNYGPGRRIWHFSDLEALRTPVKAAGALGLWTPHKDVLDAIQAQRKASQEVTATKG